MKLNCLNPILSSFITGVGILCRLAILFFILALPAHATITPETISFGTGHTTDQDVDTPYAGLTFTGQWVYITSASLLKPPDGDAITLTYTTADGGNGTFKSFNGVDRFNVTSLKIFVWGGTSGQITQFTFAGYRNGVAGPVVTVPVTPAMLAGFSTASLSGMTDVDEVRVSNNGHLAQDDIYEAMNFAFDDLAVAPYSAPLSLSPASLANPTVGSAYSQTISASAGNGTYSYAVTAGSLPAGLILNASSGVLSGTPTAGGSFSFTITATDTASATGSKAYSVTVAAPTISFSPTTLTAGTVGSAYSQSISGSGGTAPYGSYIVKTGALPAGCP